MKNFYYLGEANLILAGVIQEFVRGGEDEQTYLSGAKQVINSLESFIKNSAPEIELNEEEKNFIYYFTTYIRKYLDCEWGALLQSVISSDRVDSLLYLFCKYLLNRGPVFAKDFCYSNWYSESLEERMFQFLIQNWNNEDLNKVVEDFKFSEKVNN